MSMYGKRLELPLEGEGLADSPATGTAYRLSGMTVTMEGSAA